MIQTNRCILSEIKNEDFEVYCSLVTNEKVRTYLGGPVKACSLEDKFMEIINSPVHEQYWVVRLKPNQNFVGILSLGLHHNKKDTEISYELMPEFWGQGYGKETVSRIIDHAFQTFDISRIIAETQSQNIASCKLLERVGMTFLDQVERFGAKQNIYQLDRSNKIDRSTSA